MDLVMAVAVEVGQVTAVVLVRQAQVGQAAAVTE
jgi:hypothetical protein